MSMYLDIMRVAAKLGDVSTQIVLLRNRIADHDLPREAGDKLAYAAELIKRVRRLVHEAADEMPETATAEQAPVFKIAAE